MAQYYSVQKIFDFRGLSYGTRHAAGGAGGECRRSAPSSIFRSMQYEHLPIFKSMMELAVCMEHTAARFPRAHKYTLGSKLRSLCHQALGTIAAANSSPRRLPLLLELRQNMKRIKIHLILAREVQAFARKEQFAWATRLAVNVSRQNKGGLRSVSQKEQA